jgi:hypothetical protein
MILCGKCNKEVAPEHRFTLYKDWQLGMVVEHRNCDEPTKDAIVPKANGIVTADGTMLEPMKKSIG